MKRWIVVPVLLAGLALNVSAQTTKNYINNRAPLRANPYIEIPLGAIKAEGWLKEMLVRQKTGNTIHLFISYFLLLK